MQQASLFPMPEILDADVVAPDLDSYDKILVMYSAGKDSVACFLHLLELGVPVEKIELWHHDIDGRERSLMDWPVTPAYCRAFAEAFSVDLYFSWKQGGFEGEMTRDKAPTAPTVFETPDGTQEAGGKGPLNTRKMFPQAAADLRVRWCSSYCKIGVAESAIRNQKRFQGQHILVVTGERGQESPQRAKYATLEKHRSDARGSRLARHVDHWRPLLAWREEKVWGIIERWRVAPHPCYLAGFSRCSCAFCIFGNRDQMASAKAALPDQFVRVRDYEIEFRKTIHRTESIDIRAAAGTTYPALDTPGLKEQLRSETYEGPIILPEGAWRLPAGAFGEGCGPA